MIDINQKLCNSQAEYRAGRQKRRDFVRTLEKRLDYLTEQAEQRGIKSTYASAEMGALRHALNCMKEEYQQFREANPAFSLPQSPDDAEQTK